MKLEKYPFGFFALFMAALLVSGMMMPISVLVADNSGREAIDFTRQPGKDQVIIYPLVPFIEAGNFRELELALQDPFIYLRELFGMYNDSLSGLVAAEEQEMIGGMPFTAEINNFPEKNIPGIIDALSRIFLALYEYSEQRVKEVKMGAAQSFSADMKSGFDACFERFNIQNGARRANFMDKSSMSNEMLYRGFSIALRQEREEAPIKISWEIWKEIIRAVDYIMYGSYTVLQSASESGNEIKLRFDLTAVNIHSGERRYFSSEGSINEAATLLGEEIFDAFQKNIYTQWENPLARMEWIETRPKDLRLTPLAAREYCENQRGRLPTARQMFRAFPGGRYVNGGIELEPNEYYLVRDTTLLGDPLYFVWEISSHSGSEGPLRTAPGINFRSLFWCVRDFNCFEPAENLEKHLREEARTLQFQKEEKETNDKKRNLFLEALYYLQCKIGDLTAFPEYQNRFASVEEAVEVLRETDRELANEVEEENKNAFGNGN